MEGGSKERVNSVNAINQRAVTACLLFPFTSTTLIDAGGRVIAYPDVTPRLDDAGAARTAPIQSDAAPRSSSSTDKVSIASGAKSGILAPASPSNNPVPHFLKPLSIHLPTLCHLRVAGRVAVARREAPNVQGVRKRVAAAVLERPPLSAATPSLNICVLVTLHRCAAVTSTPPICRRPRTSWGQVRPLRAVWHAWARHNHVGFHRTPCLPLRTPYTIRHRLEPLRFQLRTPLTEACLSYTSPSLRTADVRLKGALRSVEAWEALYRLRREWSAHHTDKHIISAPPPQFRAASPRTPAPSTCACVPEDGLASLSRYGSQTVGRARCGCGCDKVTSSTVAANRGMSGHRRRLRVRCPVLHNSNGVDTWPSILRSRGRNLDLHVGREYWTAGRAIAMDTFVGFQPGCAVSASAPLVCASQRADVRACFRRGTRARNVEEALWAEWAEWADGGYFRLSGAADDSDSSDGPPGHGTVVSPCFFSVGSEFDQGFRNSKIFLFPESYGNAPQKMVAEFRVERAVVLITRDPRML
ncbi:hypothetical protein C8R47DRAFT_1193532 [Mycena vitilis]|nr:hypothetical protein C8R47DRAFT_1193532 [Mycena vitilis]